MHARIISTSELESEMLDRTPVESPRICRFVRAFEEERKCSTQHASASRFLYRFFSKTPSGPVLEIDTFDSRFKSSSKSESFGTRDHPQPIGEIS